MKKEEKKAIRKLIHRLIPLPKGTIVYLNFQGGKRKAKILTARFDKAVSYTHLTLPTKA